MLSYVSFLVNGGRQRIGAFVLLAALLAPMSAPLADVGGQPPLWRVSEGQATVYLFGTIHLLPSGMTWLRPELRRIVDDSDTLVVEVPLKDLSSPETVAFITKEGFYHDGQRLIDHLSLQRRTSLFSLVSSLDAEAPPFVAMKPWFATLTLANKLAAFHGYKSESGVEHKLVALATARGIPVKGLEEVKEHFSAFIDLPRDVQVRYLIATLDQARAFDDNIEELIHAWRMGNVDTMSALLRAGLGEEPQLMESVLYRRNEKWIPRIESYLAQPGNHFIAVGAGHLAGDRSVIDLLEKAGHTVERVF